MTDVDTPQIPSSRPARPPWGYFSTLGRVLLAHVIGSIAGFAAVYAWDPDALGSMSDINAMLKDAWVFCLSTLVAAPVMIGILWGAVLLRHWPARDYFALVWPDRRDVVIILAALAIFLPALDALAYLSGQPVVTPFQIDIYLDARRAGTATLLMLWFALVVAAPIWEELAFRGFIFRSWVRSPRSAIPGILAVSAFFAILHLQYNWFGILQVFAIGLMLAWARWRSGSTLMTILMHAVANFYSTVQTVVVLKWLS